MASTGTTLRNTVNPSKQSKLTLGEHQHYLANCMTGRNTNLSAMEIDYDSIYKYSLDGNQFRTNRNSPKRMNRKGSLFKTKDSELATTAGGDGFEKTGQI